MDSSFRINYMVGPTFCFSRAFSTRFLSDRSCLRMLASWLRTSELLFLEGALDWVLAAGTGGELLRGCDGAAWNIHTELADESIIQLVRGTCIEFIQDLSLLQ